MRRLHSLAALCFALGGTCSANAQSLSGPDLLRLLSGNTLTGYNGNLFFSEWHAPDGRVLGHNAGMTNQDSCWTVRGDAVCYYYPRNLMGEERARTEFCWHLEATNEAAYRVRAVGRPISGLAWIKQGNPRGHSDGGKDWACDALMSRRDRGGVELAGGAAGSRNSQSQR